MRKLAYIFCIALFLVGCGGKQFLHIGYDPTDSIQPFFKLGGKQPVLYIDPVIDNRKILARRNTKGTIERKLILLCGPFFFGGTRLGNNQEVLQGLVLEETT